MKVKNVEICNKSNVVFTIRQNDWEMASCPICMALISDEEWEKVASDLQDFVNGFGDDEDVDMDELWLIYESSVNRNCKVFYYEDMTDKELSVYEGCDNENDKLLILENVWKRLNK